MKRRDLITLLGGAVAGWPLTAWAQQPERVRRIGAHISRSRDDPDNQARVAAFVQGLADLGWTDGRNLKIDYRWIGTDPNDNRKYAAELIALAPDVILASAVPSTAALLEATRRVPIVFAIVPDPVSSGFVESLARPGGNATGFMQYEFSLSGKWPELLKQVAPGVTRAAVFRQPK